MRYCPNELHQQRTLHSSLASEQPPAAWSQDPSGLRPLAESMLRDMALVYHHTRSIKKAMLAEAMARTSPGAARASAALTRYEQ
jgi:hypothetical protein